MYLYFSHVPGNLYVRVTIPGHKGNCPRASSFYAVSGFIIGVGIFRLSKLLLSRRIPLGSCRFFCAKGKSTRLTNVQLVALLCFSVMMERFLRRVSTRCIMEV